MSDTGHEPSHSGARAVVEAEAGIGPDLNPELLAFMSTSTKLFRAALFRNPLLAERIEQRLRHQPGIIAARASSLTGNIRLKHTQALSAKNAGNLVDRFLSDYPEVRSTPSSWQGQKSQSQSGASAVGGGPVVATRPPRPDWHALPSCRRAGQDPSQAQRAVAIRVS